VSHFLPSVDGLENVLLGVAVLAVFLAVVALVRRRAVSLRPLILAALVIVLAHLAIFTNPLALIVTHESFSFNWGGKLLSILVTLLCIAFFPGISWKDAGFTWKQNGGAVQACIAIVLMCAFGAAVQLVAGGAHLHVPGTERLIYQATIPGLNEEPLYRGITLFLLDCAFLREGVRILGARIGWGALITSIWFGVIHGLGVAHGHIAFDPTIIVIIAIIGFFLAWIRVRTESIVLAVVAHNASNVIGAFIG
jgi:uncharacterized protein